MTENQENSDEMGEYSQNEHTEFLTDCIDRLRTIDNRYSVPRSEITRHVSDYLRHRDIDAFEDSARSSQLAIVEKTNIRDEVIQQICELPPDAAREFSQKESDSIVEEMEMVVGAYDGNQ